MTRPWRYRLAAPFSLFAPELAGAGAEGEAAEWLSLHACRLSIAAGYAWDGCSPAFPLPGGLWLGPWDGPLAADGRPVAWRASLVHDALCQFRAHCPGLSRAAATALFRRLLAEDGAPAWMQRLYPAAVQTFGPQDWRKR